MIRQAKQLFYDISRKPENDLIDEGVLFFELASKQSLQAAQSSHDRIAARTTDTSVRSPGAGPPNRSPANPTPRYSGDHDICSPVENWNALSQQLPTTQLLTYPRAGHGPHHQHPQALAHHIATFVASTSE
ncbi:alpha/beta fold hydrolase [Streptomyces justiciae]|uniref:alpha/beta fold hydrolase n=1 Tax=Streptomyces justiciae TaxID=2780140 RepID=UPI00187FD823|nr:alpha/beta hydrolase [Streptomyces justiciae]MBE8475475.1 alpha/beta hydrolase [Streptomyces justiciae]MCW8382173.1 alpha/beta hydrolase [Streptomyces justiciae]